MSTEPSLGDLIDFQIRTSGPMSIATYMSLCLTHPRHGYYSEGDPLGASGDFITAPEISQMFGELIGFFFVNLWQQMRQPPSFTLMELGPGRGTLMQDALRVAARAEGFIDALHLQLFETNPALREAQASRLAKYHPYWPTEIDAVGDGPVFYLANEFFDALPIRQFVRTEDGWHERLVGLKDDRRSFGLSPSPFPGDAIPDSVRDASPGEIVEISIAGQQAMAQMASVVARQGGAILAIDYGYPESQTGETLQAVRGHAYTDPLTNPGESDLSAHVDFGALGVVAREAGLNVPPIATQGDFLRALGIDERANMLAAANPGVAADIATARDRLTSADAMGTLFKVLCAASPGLKPAGLAE